MVGSSGSGEDIEAGRLNFAESTTVVQGGRPSELDVGFNGLAVLEAGSRRDDQRADGPVSGVLGRGWNGPDQREPGAGLIGVGAPNRGPGVVGLGGGRRITSTFLGSPGNLGEDGLGGTGIVGMGGDGGSTVDASKPDVSADAPSLPGAGVVGQGGASIFATPVTGSPDPGTGNGAGIVGIAGGRERAPNANLSQPDLAATANVGVVGFGGDGPKPVAPGGPFVGPQSPGAGVRGLGGIVSVSGSAVRIGGPGVVGVAGGVPVPVDTAVTNIGVAGISDAGFGVSGLSVEQAGVEGSSTNGPGIRGDSVRTVGVAGNSDQAVGGSFFSKEVAQIHLEPHPKPMDDPNGKMAGRSGDLLVVTQIQETQNATLWFCRTKGDAGSANWIKLA